MSRSRGAVVQVARLPFQAGDGGANPTLRLHVSTATVAEVNVLLQAEHYLGPVTAARVCFAAFAQDVMVACQVWRWPTARMLPSDGSWLELSRWCISRHAEPNTGSRMMGYVRRWLRRNMPDVSTLVSYSDPVHGHTGTLYRASGWVYTPTHHGERFDANGRGYPSGHGSWNGVEQMSPKHRWTVTL